MPASLRGVAIDPSDPSPPTKQELEDRPWKYIGYKEFSAWTASDSDFFSVRRFDRLHTRAILTLQAQLVDIEERIDTLDKHYSSRNVKLSNAKPPSIVTVSEPLDDFEKLEFRDINNGTVNDDLPERAKLVAEMTSKLVEYDKLVSKYASMRALGLSPTRNIRNIKMWFMDYPGAIVEPETKFIQHQDELISLSPPKSILRWWFEDHIVYATRKSLALFKKLPYSSTRSSDDSTVYIFSDAAVDRTASVAVFLTATAMLTMPLWILQNLQEFQWKLAVITLFVILCFAFLSIATLGRPFERLASSAGYAAVLVVFLQLGTPNN